MGLRSLPFTRGEAEVFRAGKWLAQQETQQVTGETQGLGYLCLPDLAAGYLQSSSHGTVAVGLGGLEALIPEALNPGYHLSLCWGTPKDLFGEETGSGVPLRLGGFQMCVFL